MSVLAISYIACRNYVSNVLSFSDWNSYVWLHKAFNNVTDVVALTISSCGKLCCVFTVQIINWDWKTFKEQSNFIDVFLTVLNAVGGVYEVKSFSTFKALYKISQIMINDGSKGVFKCYPSTYSNHLFCPSSSVKPRAETTALTKTITWLRKKHWNAKYNYTWLIKS